MNEQMRSPEHLSDEELLAWTDGELEESDRTRSAAHLSRCELCRDRAALMETTLSEFAAYRNQILSVEVSAARLPEFASPGPAPRSALLRRLVAFATPVRSWRFAAGFAALIVILAWLHFASGPSLSGDQLLGRAMAAELSAEQRVPQPVCYQRLQLRRAAGLTQAAESATLETWSRRAGFRLAHKGGGRIWSELETVYSSNGLTGHRPLAPGAYQAWSKSLPAKAETVSRTELANGVEALRITTKSRGPVSSGKLLEASLVVRAGDWHPVQETLRVQGDGEVWEYELLELAFEIIPVSTLQPEVLAMLQVPLPSLPPPPAPAAPASPVTPAWDPDRAEIEARFALHRVHACAGEPIEIAHAGSALTVRGVVDSADRRAEVTQALRGIPHLRLELRSAEEYARRAASPTAPPLDSPEPQAAPPSSAWETRLPPELADVANRAVSLADDALAEAWALRRLAESFPRERVQRLAPDSRSMLETMVRDHASELHRNLAETRALLSSVAPAQAAPAGRSDRFEWPLGVTDLFVAVERERESVRALFANPDGSGRAQAALRFAELIVAAEHRAAQLERDSASIFQPGTGEDPTGLKRKE
jgi:anti-sigma factor RsiW